MSFIFDNLFGTQPLAFLDSDKTAVVVMSSNHKLLTESVGVLSRIPINNSIHGLASSNSLIRFSVEVYDSIHKQTNSNKLNAPVKFTCARYLNTQQEDRYLQTKTVDRYLETPLKPC